MDSRRLLKRGLPIVGAIALGALLLYADWIRRAPSVDEPRGDAVVVHAGQRTRLAHALDLMEQGAAPTLVIMFGEDQPRSRRLCGRTEPFEVICPTPEASNTIGEATELGRLVEERGWSTVVAVTSDYHLRRATFLDRKCADVDVVGSGAGNGVPRRSVVGRIAREMAAMVQARFTQC